MTESLRRELGRWDATAIVIGAIVGVGIFFTPSRVAALTTSEDQFLLTWLIGGAIALLGALTFAELGSTVSRTGGQYDILRDAYGPGLAFVFVTCNATAIEAGALGIVVIVFVDNAAIALTGHALAGPAMVAAAVTTIAAIATINALGVRQGARLQNLTVLAKIGALVAVIVIAAVVGDAAPSQPEAPPPPAAASGSYLTGIVAALVPVLFTFGGGQVVLWVGGEVKDPTRTVPWAIIVGISVVVTVYLGVNWAYLDLLGHAAVASSESPAAAAVDAAIGDGGRRLMAAAVGVSALGILSTHLLAGPRLLLAMARDGRFFSIFGRVNARRGTPIPAIVLLGGVTTLLLLAAGADGLDQLLTGVVLVDAVFFMLTGLASIVLLRHRPRHTRPLRMPGFPVVPLLFVLAQAGVIVGAWLDPGVRGAAAIGVGWIGAAALLYLLRFRRGSGKSAAPSGAGSEGDRAP